MVEAWLKYVVGEMRVIAQALVIFFGALTMISIAIWKALGWRHAPKDDLIALYKARLDGASPDEARARIKSLEAIIDRTIGAKWDPLTEREIKRLAEGLSKIKDRPTYINIGYLNYLGDGAAHSLETAFRQAAWKTEASLSADMEEGLTIGPYPKMSALIKDAIESSTRLRVTGMPDQRHNEINYGSSYSMYIEFGADVSGGGRHT